MTNDEINAAITEATGLWDHPYSNDTKRMYDFCSDLNAMHEAEKLLSSDALFVTYYLTLYDTTQSTRWPVCATARQRAEAFLRTLGLWQATNKESLTVERSTTEESSVDQKEVQK